MIPTLADGSPDNMHWYEYRHVTDLNGDLCIQRIHDGAWIPQTKDNGDYRRYLKFIAKVKAPEEVDLRTEEGKAAHLKNDEIASQWHKERCDEQVAARAIVEKQLAEESAQLDEVQIDGQ